MAGPFPCPNPPSPCETNPNPATPYSSEAQDSTTFIGVAWNGTPPPLNKPFNLVPCEAIVDSQVSQADADRLARNAAVTCASPCATPFQNTAQTATGQCPDGSSYSLTIPAGQYTAENQVLADRLAFTAAVQALRGHSICLGSLAPTAVCRGEFYFGQISVITTDSPSTIQLVAGSIPDGLSISFESNRVVLQGTPTDFGKAMFSIVATSSVGVITSKTYEVSVTGIVTSSLPDGTVGDAYSTQLQAVIPDGTVTVWSVSSGTLPDGLTLDAATGQISGSPTTAETNSFTVSVTAGDQTCSRQFSLKVSSGVIPPHCLTNTGIAFDTIVGGSPFGPLQGTSIASVQRMVLVSADDGKVVFINTATNAVVATIALSLSAGYDSPSAKNQVAFATSTQNFFFVNAAFTAATVTDINGNVVGSIAPPGGANFGTVPFVYSPDADKVYTVQNIGGNMHILEYDPHTLLLTRDVDAGAIGSVEIFCYPGNVVLYNAFFRNYPISTLINDKTSPFFQTRGQITYDPVSNRLFAGQSFSNDVRAINISDFSLGTDFVSTNNVGPYQWLVYNPVTKSIIAMDAFGEAMVIDPALDSIVCEITPMDPSANGLVVDYMTGDVYTYLFDGGNNQVNVWD